MTLFKFGDDAFVDSDITMVAPVSIGAKCVKRSVRLTHQRKLAGLMHGAVLRGNPFLYALPIGSPAIDKHLL